MGKGVASCWVSHPEKTPAATALLFDSSFTPSCPAPPAAPLPSLLMARWKPPQPLSVVSKCRSANYQRTSLPTAWGIQRNPVNVFILKKRCTFNRNKQTNFGFFFLLLAFFCKKGKKKYTKKKKSIMANGKRCSHVCVCARVPCQPTVDLLLARDRRSPPTPMQAGGGGGAAVHGYCIVEEEEERCSGEETAEASRASGICRRWLWRTFISPILWT